jgi:hypothetical protein
MKQRRARNLHEGCFIVQGGGTMALKKFLTTLVAPKRPRGSCLSIFCMLIASIAATPAQAEIFAYNFGGLTFADGATATGHISFDSSIPMPPVAALLDHYVVDFEIATHGGNTLSFPDYIYTTGNAVGSAIYHPNGIFTGVNIGIGAAVLGARAFRINFDPFLLGNDTIALNFSNPFLNQECYDCNPQRLITSGSLLAVAVPEPEIYAMLTVGLGLIGWVGRRKKSKEAAIT